MAKLIMKNGCDDWKSISDRFGLKSRKEAILEFMKLSQKDIDECLASSGYQPDRIPLPEKQIYNHSDMYKHHC